MKKLLKYGCAVLALVLVFDLCLTALNFGQAEAAGENPYSDVPDGAWYSDDTLWCYENNIMSGVGDGRFDPDAPMNRAMLVTVLYRAEGTPAVTDAPTFPDVSAGQWYFDAVAWAAKNGVVDGYADGNFGPTDRLTREQAVTILWRYAEKPDAGTSTGFADESEIAGYALSAVAWAKENDVVGGVGNNQFAPKDGITRAQAAAILARLLRGGQDEPAPSAGPSEPAETDGNGVLVVYFSATDNTRRVAQTIAETLGADIFELDPTEPYTSADLDWTDPNSRVSREHNDASLRNVALVNAVPENWDNYGTVFVGYPIWWGGAAWPVNGFVTANDFTGKTVIPFCTSSSSGMGSSGAGLAALAGEGDWQDGRRFQSGASETTVTEWVASLDLTPAVPADPTAPTAPTTPTEPEDGTSVVYFTSDISSEGMLAVYKALGWTPTGDVAVKLSTGEPPASNYLRPELIEGVVKEVNGTIVECNTAYGGSRSETAMHYQVAEDHGFTAIANVDILDADGSMELPVDGEGADTVLSSNLVGSHFADYDSYVVLSHFKGHAMAGFGGAIKNISIGLGSKEGKCLIHTGGRSHTSPWGGDQTAFTESMAEAGKSVSDYLGEGERIIYISVLNNISIDCDCNGNPAEPDIHDIGILASTDPVAIDQAAYDLCKAAEGSESLMQRIDRQNGLHTLEHAEEIGLGSRTYTLTDIDRQ